MHLFIRNNNTLRSINISGHHKNGDKQVPEFDSEWRYLRVLFFERRSDTQKIPLALLAHTILTFLFRKSRACRGKKLIKNKTVKIVNRLNLNFSLVFSKQKLFFSKFCDIFRISLNNGSRNKRPVVFKSRRTVGYVLQTPRW